MTLIITNGLPVHQIPRSFSFLGEGNVLGVPFVLWMLVVCAVVTHVHSGAYAPGPLRLRDRQQPGGRGIRGRAGGIAYTTAVYAYRRNADGPGRDDRSVAADDGPADGRATDTSCRRSRR